MPDLTYGGRAVGLTFNPTGDSRVDRIKQRFADIIDELMGPDGNALPYGEKSALTIIAMRQTQSAQMWAIKAATWADDELAGNAASRRDNPAGGLPTGYHAADAPQRNTTDRGTIQAPTKPQIEPIDNTIERPRDDETALRLPVPESDADYDDDHMRERSFVEDPLSA